MVIILQFYVQQKKKIYYINKWMVYGVMYLEYQLKFHIRKKKKKRIKLSISGGLCTLVSGIVAECKTLRYLVEDLTVDRNVYIRPPFSLIANTLSVTVVDNVGAVVVENLDNIYDDELIFSVPGTQTFQFQVSTGSSYNIEVVSQPEGQQCTVTENGQGIAYGPVSVSIYCTAGCDVPTWLPQLTALNFSTVLADDLCMIGPQYYWNGQPTCVAGSADTEGVCDHYNYVCPGVLGRTYGSMQAQKEALEEVLRADEFCLLDGEVCDIDNDSCCNPYSQCLWNLEDSFEFESRCTQCKDCDVWLNECDKCKYQPGEAVRSYRCPVQNCEPLTADPVFSPDYWGPYVEYCELNNYIYMNGFVKLLKNFPLYKKVASPKMPDRRDGKDIHCQF